MEESTNPKKSNFLEDLQKASEEIEVGFQRKKPVSRPQPNSNPPSTRGAQTEAREGGGRVGVPREQAPVKEKATLEDYNPPTTSEEPAEGRRVVGGLESRSSLRSERAPVKVENEILARDWLGEIINERQKLEQAYKEAENLRRKIQQRLDRMKNLEINFSKVKNELAHFQQIKKENQAFLEEIKNMLKNQNEHRA